MKTLLLTLLLASPLAQAAPSTLKIDPAQAFGAAVDVATAQSKTVFVDDQVPEVYGPLSIGRGKFLKDNFGDFNVELGLDTVNKTMQCKVSLLVERVPLGKSGPDVVILEVDTANRLQTSAKVNRVSCQ